MKGMMITVACVAFLFGVTVYFSSMEIWAIVFCSIAVITALIFMKIKKKFLLFVIITIFSSAGFFWSVRYDVHHASKLRDDYFDKKIILIGDVIDDPDIGVEKTRVIVQPVQINDDFVSREISDRILVRLGPGVNISYGDRIRMSGVIEHPENFITETDREFDYENYLALNDVYGIMRVYGFEMVSRHHGSVFLEKLFSFKKYFVKKLKSVFPAPESGLLAGIMIGEKSLLPETVLADFQSAGLMHMIVLSGYNVTIVAITIATAFSWIGLGYRGRRIGALIVIPIFILMTGLDASAARAGIMAMVAFILQITTRPANTFRIVALTLLIMVFTNPRTLLHDPSLHLSYLAFLGLIYMTPIVANWFSRFSEWYGMRDLITETFAVQIFVMPYILYMNGNVSLLLLVSNILTVPLSPIAMGVGFFATLGAIAFFPLGLIIAFPVKWILSYIIWIAHAVASLNMFSFTIPPFGMGWMMGMYALATGFLIFFHRSSIVAKNKDNEPSN